MGEIAGYPWQPYGGGSSITLSGLLGGLIMLMLKRDGPVQVALPVCVLSLAALYSKSSYTG